MSSTLIDQDEFNGEILLNTFYGGSNKGVCSQLTLSNKDKGYTQMTLDNMISFFKLGLKKLQEKKDDLLCVTNEVKNE